MLYSPEQIRTSSAYHEAAHAVVAAHYGWWIVDPGIQIDATCHTAMRCSRHCYTRGATITISLAGELAARRHLGISPVCGRLEEAEIDQVYREIVGGYCEEVGDTEDVLSLLIDAGYSPPRLCRLFNRLERMTLRFIQGTKIWPRIEGLASLLIERGDLAAPEANAIMGNLGCFQK